MSIIHKVTATFRVLMAVAMVSPALMVSSGAQANSLPPEVRMVFFSFAPFNFVGPDNRPAGELVDLFHQMVTTAGLTGSATEYPVRRARTMIIDGEADVLLTNNTAPELQGHILSSPQPILTIVTEAVALQPLSPTTMPDMLKGRSVILQDRYSYGGLMDVLKDPANSVRLIGFPSDAVSGLRMLLAQRGDVYIQYANKTNEAIAQLSVTQTLHRYPLGSIPVYINVSKRVPYAQPLLDALVGAWAKLKASGAAPRS